MPGKYAHILPDLPRLRGAVSDDPGYQGKVDATKAQIAAPSTETDRVVIAERKETMESADYRVDVIHASLLRAAALTNRQASDYLPIYLELRALKDRVTDWLSTTNLLLEAYTQLLVDQMEVEHLGTLKGASGRGVSTYLEPYPQVKDREAFRLWCLEQHLDTQMHLHPGTTKNLVKKILEAGEPLPEGVEVYAKPTVRLVGGKE